MDTDKAAWITIQRAVARVPLMRRRKVDRMLQATTRGGPYSKVDEPHHHADTAPGPAPDPAPDAGATPDPDAAAADGPADRPTDRPADRPAAAPAEDVDDGGGVQLVGPLLSLLSPPSRALRNSMLSIGDFPFPLDSG